MSKVSKTFRAVSAAMCLGAAALCAAVPASAQGYWPTAAQWAHIKQSAQDDAEAQRVLQAQHRLAEQALGAVPQPVATVTSAGRLLGDARKEQTRVALKDMEKIQALAVCFALDGDRSLAQRAGDFLEAWARVNVPTGQPIDETSFEPAVFGYRIVRAELAPEVRTRIDVWLREMARAELASRDMRQRTSVNNWQSHRLKNVALIAYALQDRPLIERVRQGFRDQVLFNLLPDGASIDFQERDALSYHVYDLRPLLTMALLFAGEGEDLYHWQARNGASLARSVEWLLPYLNGEKSHAEFVHTSVAFDKARAVNREPGHEIGAPYPAKSALPVLDQSAAFDPRHAALAAQLDDGHVRLRTLISRF